MRGRPFEPKVAEMKRVIISLEGHLTNVAKYFGVGTEAVYGFLNRHKELKKTLEEAREYRGEKDVEIAERVIRVCMDLLEENPRLAQDTAKYVLDHKGHKHGWTDKGASSSQENVKGMLEDLSLWTDDAYKKLKKDDSQ